jgi:hypothetical protein
MMRKKLTALAAASTLAVSGAAAPAALAQQQDGLVNVSIGDVNILRNVDLALAANVVANLCAQDVTVAVLATVDETGQEFTCTQRGSGRAVAVTDN